MSPVRSFDSLLLQAQKPASGEGITVLLRPCRVFGVTRRLMTIWGSRAIAECWMRGTKC